MIPYPPHSLCDYSHNERNGEGGFPHSEIAGSKFAHNSPTLIAACHVLHRLYMPRHPPNALTSRLRIHTINDRPGTKPLAACIRRQPVQPMLLTCSIGADDNLSQIITSVCAAWCSPDPKSLRPQVGCHAPRHRLKTHSQCQRSGQIPQIRSKPELLSSSLEYLVIQTIWWSLSGSNR